VVIVVSLNKFLFQIAEFSVFSNSILKYYCIYKIGFSVLNFLFENTLNSLQPFFSCSVAFVYFCYTFSKRWSPDMEGSCENTK
jgi:hypothetical protein